MCRNLFRESVDLAYESAWIGSQNTVLFVLYSAEPNPFVTNLLPQRMDTHFVGASSKYCTIIVTSLQLICLAENYTNTTFLQGLVEVSYCG